MNASCSSRDGPKREPDTYKISPAIEHYLKEEDSWKKFSVVGKEKAKTTKGNSGKASGNTKRMLEEMVASMEEHQSMS